MPRQRWRKHNRSVAVAVLVIVILMATVLALVAIAGPAVLVPLPAVIEAVRRLVAVVASSGR